MQQSTVPLSQIHPSWRGSVVASYFDAVMRGIELENAHHVNAKFITLLFRSDLDYDGLTDSLELLEGFSKKADAKQFVDSQATQTLNTLLKKPGLGTSAWHHNVARDNARIKPHKRWSRVRCVHLRSFELTLDTGYDAKRVQFEVLRVKSSPIIGPDLLAYYDAQEEWTDYFVAKARP